MKCRPGMWMCGLGILLHLSSVEGQASVNTDTTQVSLFPPRGNISEGIGILSLLIIPKVIQDEYRLKDFIRGDSFSAFRKAHGDLAAVDAIFDRAMALSWSNVHEALLISMLATFEHRTVGITLPLIGPLLWFPLTAEFEDDFRIRVEALPCRLYPDSPADVGGDRDKLQHFFGSAFLTYTLESCETADRIGEFIEWGEDKFVVDGAMDERDTRANRQGQQFGLRLLDDRSVFPSGFFKIQNTSHSARVKGDRDTCSVRPDSISTALEEK